MPTPLIQSAFTAGEVAPQLWGQVDLRKYQTGLALARNMLVDFRGGTFSRPGTAFVAQCLPQYAEGPPCLLPFIFNQDQSYVLELSGSSEFGNRMRVIQGGAPVLHDGKGITAVTATNPATVTINTGAYAVGDRLYFSGATGLLRDNGVSGINGRTLQVVTSVGNDVTLKDPTTGFMFRADNLTAYGASGVAQAEVNISSPWGADALFELKWAQSADVMTVCHADYPVYEIRRLSQTSWTITAAVFGTSLDNPFPPAAVQINNDLADQQYFFSYAITAYNTNSGEESIVGLLSADVQNRALDQNNGVANQLSWPAVDGANMYRIYKAQPVPWGYQGAPPYFRGLVGQTPGLSFVDNNFEPDFAQAPPDSQDFFVSGPIDSVTVDTPGFGYQNPALVIADTTGFGAVLTATVDTAGALDPVVTITNGGERYSAPTVSVIEDRALYVSGSGLSLSFSDSWTAINPGVSYTPAPGSITISAPGSGFHVPYITYTYAGGGETSFQTGTLYGTITSGAVTGLVNMSPGVAAAASAPSGGTMTFTITDVAADTFGFSRAAVSVGIDGTTPPSCVAYFQQRLVYAASNTAPTTFWMSKPGEYANFSTTYPSLSDDAIQATVVNGEQNAIVSMVAMTTGLIALTAGGAFLIAGDSAGGPVTPSTINARQQTFSGAAPLQPLRVEDRLVYLHARRTSVRDFTYDFFTNVYRGADLSVLSPHLFAGRDILQWTYAAEPNKLVWAVRDDGVLLTLTYLKEQEVAGWTHCDTQGQYVSVCSIPETNQDAVYVVVRRLIAGTYHYVMERFASRDFGQNVPLNIPSQPERVWCVDCGARSALTYPNATLTTEAAFLNVLGNPVIVDGGSGYTAPVATVVDGQGVGTGGAVTLSVTGGVITGATTTNVGSNYLSPQIIIEDVTGQGGVVVVPATNVYVFNVSSPILSGADLGKVLRVGGGIGTVSVINSTTQMVVTMDNPLPGRLPNTPDVVLAPTFAGDWSMTAPSFYFGGLDWLNGQMVQIVADGSVHPPQVVSDGCIQLQIPATLVVAGMGYTCQVQTLRPDAGLPTIQGRRRTVTSTTLRLMDSRGVAIGNSFDSLYEQKERNNERYGQPISFQIGGGALAPTYDEAPIGQDPIGYQDAYTNLGGGWDTQGHLCLLQSWPMPVHLLAYVSEIVLGDTDSR